MEGLTEADGARAQALGVLAALIVLNSRLLFWGSGSAGHAGAQANLKLTFQLDHSWGRSPRQRTSAAARFPNGSRVDPGEARRRENARR